MSMILRTVIIVDYASRIVELRKAQGLTQKQLALNTKLSEIGIQGYESRRRKPAYDALIALANCFNVSMDYIAGRTNNPQIAR